MIKIMTFIVVFFCSLLGGAAQILLKKGSDNFVLSFQLIHNYWLIGGFLLYGIAFLLYTYMLKHGSVSVLYPIISLSYVWVALLAFYFLKEPFTIPKIIGSLMIVGGVYLMSIF